MSGFRRAPRPVRLRSAPQGAARWRSARVRALELGARQARGQHGLAVGREAPDDAAGPGGSAAAFDGAGVLWFTGQTGVYGRLDPRNQEMRVWRDPEGRGPYGIAATPSGEIYYVSLAGSHLARIDRETGAAPLREPVLEAAGPTTAPPGSSATRCRSSTSSTPRRCA